MSTNIQKKKTIVGTDAQYEAHKDSYEEGTVFESTSLLGESDIDPTYTNKFVERKVSESGLYAYCFDTTGITKTRYVSEGFPAYSLVERDEKGRVRTADPVGQNDATTKKYVDDGFVKKVTTKAIVYGTSASNGSQIAIPWNTAEVPNTVVMRDNNGRTKVADPEGQNDAVNKAYVDNKFRYTHFIEVKYNPAPAPYEAYTLIGIITYVSEVSTALTSIDDLPLDVALPMHGKVYGNKEQDTYTATRKTRSDGSSYLEVAYLQYTDSDGITTTTTNLTPTSFTDTVL